ncbi:pyrophosphohydrolase domain-containing protein [Salegentibacter salegens]|uniref:Predicted phosphohydrolase, Cof family, HAD superfamily n=1 Tax=Salegentibacter salegens TaxID=143223 RepID=A0A1M7NR37_9FLAO|nr:nucleoside triphosphate pyrophosphohydrolase family protein [Salegentibacter salegens]PRX38715.1 putative HAD superfamily Cof-like phosphohydrolase [Salegentibacter salegens]SHN06441.1 Predicted phosphohydrolase, Cof family, HAD superfamily [Salegentibacter salegens]
MKKRLAAVKEFHKIFKLGIAENLRASLGAEKNRLRYELMKEENEEYLEAANNGDLTEVADALGDMLYVLCGTIIEHGLEHKIEAVFDEIQHSNMSKLDGNGNPMYNENGKVIKGPDYVRPNIAKVLKD